MEIVSREEFAKRIIESGKAKGISEEVYLDEAKSLGALHFIPEGDILVVKGTPSSFRIHEVGHKVLGHSSKYNIEDSRTIGDEILDEILAEKFVYETKDKRLTYRLALPAINMLVSDRYGFSPEGAVHWTLHILSKELGIVPTKKERRELARHARGLLRRPR